MWNLKLFGLATTVTLTLAVGSAWYGYSNGRQSGMSQIRSEWALESAQIAAAQAEQAMKARQTEEALQKAINRIRQEKTREAIKLANDFAAVVDSLHDRPEARAGSTGVPEGAAAGVGCTGAGLAKRDSEFLAGYGRDAARLQLALDACQAAYDQVRESINGRD